MFPPRGAKRTHLKEILFEVHPSWRVLGQHGRVMILAKSFGCLHCPLDSISVCPSLNQEWTPSKNGLLPYCYSTTLHTCLWVWDTGLFTIVGHLGHLWKLWSGWSLFSRVPGSPTPCLFLLFSPLISNTSCLSFSSSDASVYKTLKPLFPY